MEKRYGAVYVPVVVNVISPVCRIILPFNNTVRSRYSFAKVYFLRQKI